MYINTCFLGDRLHTHSLNTFRIILLTATEMQTGSWKNSVYGTKTLSDESYKIYVFSPLSFVYIKIWLSIAVMFVGKKTFLSHIDSINTGRHFC